MRYFVLLIIIPFFGFSQNPSCHKGFSNSTSNCKLLDVKEDFSSDIFAAEVVEKILSVVGIPRNFILQSCDNINNCFATTKLGKRYIVYDRKFLNDISKNIGSNWSNISILAHEIGHHLSGHTVDQLVYDNNLNDNFSVEESHKHELEADEFSGFIIAKLGGRISDATSIFSRIPNHEDSNSSHPTSSKRIEAIKKGFFKGSENKNSNTTTILNSDILYSHECPKGTGADLYFAGTYKGKRYTGVFIDKTYDANKVHGVYMSHFNGTLDDKYDVEYTSTYYYNKGIMFKERILFSDGNFIDYSYSADAPGWNNRNSKKVVAWYSNGLKATEYNSKKGNYEWHKVGVYKKWDEKGIIYYKANYNTEGEENGWVLEWDKSITFDNGDYQGGYLKSKKYYKNGILDKTKGFHQGDKYNKLDDDFLEIIAFYSNDNYKEYFFYYKNGSLYTRNIFSDWTIKEKNIEYTEIDAKDWDWKRGFWGQPKGNVYNLRKFKQFDTESKQRFIMVHQIIDENGDYKIIVDYAKRLKNAHEYLLEMSYTSIENWYDWALEFWSSSDNRRNTYNFLKNTNYIVDDYQNWLKYVGMIESNLILRSSEFKSKHLSKYNDKVFDRNDIIIEKQIN